MALELDDDQAILTVSDRGPALSDVAIRSVFEREPQWPGADPTRRGDGLTLSMAKTIAELHDGTIGVRNRPEGGVAFEVASYLGVPLDREIVELDGNGEGTHPFLLDDGGQPFVVEGPPGGRLVVLTLPFGSIRRASLGTP